MAQPQLDPTPSSHPLTLVPSSPPHVRRLRARRRLLVSGVTTICLLALTAIGYLCCLVRIMHIDAMCKTRLEECARKEAEIGGLTIRLSAATDARRIERFAEARKLAPPQRVDQIEVSADLCREHPPQPVAPSEGSLLAANTWSGTRSFLR